jgi:hypothetical protein
MTQVEYHTRSQGWLVIRNCSPKSHKNTSCLSVPFRSTMMRAICLTGHYQHFAPRSHCIGTTTPTAWHTEYRHVKVMIANPSGRAVYGVGLRPFACWDCGFESHQGHGYLCLLSVVCCHVEVSASGWSLVQRSPTECGVCLSVIATPRQWGGPGPLGALAPWKKKTWTKRSCKRASVKEWERNQEGDA